MKRLVMTTALVALLPLAAGAGQMYTYKFPAGKERQYRLTMASKAKVVLPDGRLQTLEFSIHSLLAQTGIGEPAPDGSTKVSTRVLEVKTKVNGKDAPPAGDFAGPRVIVVRPSGRSASADPADHLPVVFPEHALDRGSSFETSGVQAFTDAGLAFKTTYTLVEPTTHLVYPAPGTGTPRSIGPLAMFEARLAIAGTPAGADGPRKLTLRKGEGKVWFDNASGTLVRSKTSYGYDEEVAQAGGKVGRRSVAVVVELVLVP